MLGEEPGPREGGGNKFFVRLNFNLIQFVECMKQIQRGRGAQPSPPEAETLLAFGRTIKAANLAVF